MSKIIYISWLKSLGQRVASFLNGLQTFNYQCFYNVFFEGGHDYEKERIFGRRL